ncbi:hypothetical protein JCM10212_002774 [Sporobolomyces blumeae]
MRLARQLSDLLSSTVSHPDHHQLRPEPRNEHEKQHRHEEEDILKLLDALDSSPVSKSLTSPSLSATTSHDQLPPSVDPSLALVQDAVPAPVSIEPDNTLGFLFDTSFDSLSQAKPQQQAASSFSMDGKRFDAGDISAPFDLSLPLFDTIAYPVYSTAPSSLDAAAPLGPGVDPGALDATLESPLGFSQDASPWSELLASPMFSLPNSEPASGTLSELPLPSPPALDPSLNARTALASLPLFPPLTSPVPPPASTILRPLPPVPVRPGPAPVQTPALSSSSSSSHSDSLPLKRSAESLSSSKSSSSRPEPNGFRTTTPLLGLEAPIQTRNPVLASSTSRKRKTAAAERTLAKRNRVEASPPAALSNAAADGDTSMVSAPPAPVDASDLPADIVAAIERKRLQNTLSARKSRARKQARMQELEEENRLLSEENDLLRRRLEAFEQAAGHA